MKSVSISNKEIEKKTLKFNMNDAASAKENDWVNACIEAARNDNFYKIFRSSKAFQRVIEGSPITAGLWNLKRLLKNSIFRKSLHLIQTSDTIGLPLNMIDFVTSSFVYSLSPTTLRYTNNALNCLSLFGKNIFNGKVNIYEIGAGYGGECKIFNDIATTLFKRNLNNKWFVYDLPTSRELVKLFLSNFGYTVNFVSMINSVIKRNTTNMVISNGAFSEMRGPLLTSYFNSVITKAKFGYFITNFESHSAPYGGWTTEEFIKRLHDCGKIDATVLSTTEYLSYFDQQAGSKLIVFGHKYVRKNNTKIIDIIRIRLIERFERFIHVFLEKFIIIQ